MIFFLKFIGKCKQNGLPPRQALSISLHAPNKCKNIVIDLFLFGYYEFFDSIPHEYDE